jgi:hypothetical protein
MSAVKKATLPLIVALAVAVTVSAQEPAPLSESTVEGLEVAFVGFDGQNRPAFDVTVELAAHGPSVNGDTLIVRLRDDCNPAPYNPTAPEASWFYAGRSSKPVRVTVRLPAPLYFRGPLMVDALMEKTQRIGLMLGQIMLPEQGSGITPYGAVDLKANCLHLHAEPAISFVPALHLSVQGAPAHGSGLFVLSTECVRLPVFGGTLCINPGACIWHSPILKADGAGCFETLFPVPSHPALVGKRFYFQAVAVGTKPSRPVLFSNGIEVEVQGAK